VPDPSEKGLRQQKVCRLSEAVSSRKTRFL
jgi:hypothetical protein